MTATQDGTRTNGAPRTLRGAEGKRAAVRAAQELHAVRVTVPGLGEIPLPSADELAFIAGIGALGVIGALEWPVVVVLGTGRLLTHVHRWRSLAAFGDALEHA